MKKFYIAIMATVICGMFFAVSTTAQNVYVLSAAKYKALSDSLELSTKGTAKTRALNPDNGRRAFHATAGASYSFGADCPAGSFSLGYQLGKNGGFEFGAQAEAGRRYMAEGYVKQNLGVYTAENYVIPALKIGIGACDQDQWAAAQTDPSLSQGVGLAFKSIRQMKFCASAEFCLKLKPTRKEPRFYMEAFGGYRITPYWGKELASEKIASKNTDIYDIELPVAKKFGYAFVGVRLGWSFYRVK